MPSATFRRDDLYGIGLDIPLCFADRGSFYDAVGCLRDVVQNYL